MCAVLKTKEQNSDSFIIRQYSKNPEKWQQGHVDYLQQSAQCANIKDKTWDV